MPLLRALFWGGMLLLAFTGNALSQTIGSLDSLEGVLKTEKTDTATLNQYLKRLDAMSNENIEAKEIIGKWIIERCNTPAFNLIKAQTYQVMGKSYARVSAYTKATDFYNNAILLSENNDFYENLSVSLNGLGNIFIQLGQKAEALTNYKKGLAVAETHDFKDGIALNKFQMASCIKVKWPIEKPDSFNLKFKLLNEALQIWETLKDTTRMVKGYIQCGESYANYDYFDSGFAKIEKAKPFLSVETYARYQLDYNFMQGKVYTLKAEAHGNNTDDLQRAIGYFNACFPLAIKYNEIRYQTWYYGWMARCYKNLNDYKSAYDFRLKYNHLDDSVLNEKNFREIAGIQHQYEQSKKENEMLRLNAAVSKKSIINKILIAGALVLLVTGVLMYRNFRGRQKLQLAKITELEKDKQLLAIDAMLKGQEEERSRIAKDLHDGLGGMLSGTKLSFMNMKEVLILSPENAALFDKSLSMLDNTIGDLRKVAHNLMPEALVKYGLYDAIRDFCDTAASASAVTVDYQQMGTQRKLSNTAEVFTYRIIQELVNNALKHAGAKELIVQLTTGPGKINITVEDDGKGYDAKTAAAKKGAGLDNIQYRVQYFNGTIDTITSPGNGTSVNIELFV